MKALMVIGILCIALGVFGFARGGFSYTKEKGKADLGPVEVKVTDKEKVRMSPVLSGLAVAGGVALLVAGARKR